MRRHKENVFITSDRRRYCTFPWSWFTPPPHNVSLGKESKVRGREDGIIIREKASRPRFAWPQNRCGGWKENPRVGDYPSSGSAYFSPLANIAKKGEWTGHGKGKQPVWGSKQEEPVCR